MNDHCRKNAFLREILLFDRLVIPVPADEEERQRWRRPDPARPELTWNPDRLDKLLTELGTGDNPGYNGAKLVWPSKWTVDTWEQGMTRQRAAAEAAKQGNPAMWKSFGNPYLMTREIIRHDPGLPNVVEAVAAYPSEQAFEAEVALSPVDQTENLSEAELYVALARPLLVPDAPHESESAYNQALREAIDLACDPEYRQARAAYLEWLRQQTVSVRERAANRDEVEINSQSQQLLRERIDELYKHEKQLQAAARKRTNWTRVEWATAVIGMGVAVAAAAVPIVGLPALAAGLGALGSVITFAGFGISKKEKPSADRALNGASMFVTAEQRLKWLRVNATD